MMIKAVASVLLGFLAMMALPESAVAQNSSQADKPASVSFAQGENTVHGLLWGRGTYGVILAHGAIYDAASWAPLAGDIARNGMVALSLEEARPDYLVAANAWLREEYGVKEVAVVGASAGGSSSIRAMTRSPQQWDQLVLLSSLGDVSGLGPAPKLFVVSEGEGMADAVRRMAKEAPGAQNELLVFEGSAHAQAIFRTPHGPRLTQKILERLMKRAQGGN